MNDSFLYRKFVSIHSTWNSTETQNSQFLRTQLKESKYYEWTTISNQEPQKQPNKSKKNTRKMKKKANANHKTPTEIKIQKPLRFNQKSTELGVPRTRAPLCVCWCVWQLAYGVAHWLFILLRSYDARCMRGYPVVLARRGKGVFSRPNRFFLRLLVHFLFLLLF